MNTSTLNKKIVSRHIHVYDIDPTRAVSEVIAAAEKDASSFWTEQSLLSADAVEYSSPEVKVGVNEESGGTFAYWVQAGTPTEKLFPSTANSVSDESVHIYEVTSAYPSATEVRDALSQAESEAKAYAAANQLAFDVDIIRLTTTEKGLVIMWSADSE